MSRAVEVSLFPELRCHKAVGPLVGSVITGTNADLIHTIRDLYLAGTVLDVTYGEGAWWNHHQPTEFHGSDLNTGTDFRDLPWPDRSWDTVCFDPPYIPAGGPGNAGDFQDRYGLRGGRNQTTLEDLIRPGLAECARVARAFVLVKCQDYVNGGRFTPMSYTVAGWATDLGLVMHDEIVHHSGSGPGGHNIVNQLRARRHHSKLLVFTPKAVYS